MQGRSLCGCLLVAPCNGTIKHDEDVVQASDSSRRIAVTKGKARGHGKKAGRGTIFGMALVFHRLASGFMMAGGQAGRKAFCKGLFNKMGLYLRDCVV